jgi:predicted DNA-binding protein
MEVGDAMRKKTNSHMTSLRLPVEWHKWIELFADNWNTTPSYIYRTAIREFMAQKQGVQR